MTRILSGGFAALLVAAIAAAPAAMAKSFAEMFPQYQDIDQGAKDELGRLDYRQGEVTLGDGIAKLNVPEGYYFLGPADARIVLEEFWGNPPSEGTLGMIFPADTTPFHSDGWGLEVTFDPIGYVSDEDATTIDYAGLLADMQRDVRTANKARKEQGFDEVELLGWAEPPTYDPESRKLHWAKELHFSSVEGNTLNFNVRALGRKGVLVMNFIAHMEALPQVKAALPEVLAMSDFTPGNTYADFDPGVDTVAAVGIGGLIAGKALAKTGLLVVLLAFLKKGIFLVVVPILWLWNRLTGRRSA